MPIAWILALAVVSLDTDLTVQRVIVEPVYQTVASGDIATLTVVYDSVNPTLTGLGVRLHYDSSKITLEDVDVLFSQDLSGVQDQEDLADNCCPAHHDGDPTTDRRFLAGWSSLVGEWPGNGVSLPLELLRLTFRTHGVYPSTRISVTGFGCGLCSLETHPVVILIAGGGPTLTATVTRTPSRSPTVTRTPTITKTPTVTRTPTPGPSPTAGPQGPFAPPGGAPPPPPASELLDVPAVPAASDLGLTFFVSALMVCALVLLFRRR
jgi:hypothetical protein